MKTIDVGAVLDDRPVTGYQKLLVVATALAVVVGGLNIQVLSGAIPAMLRDLQLPRGALTPALTAGLLGMMLGSFAGGIAGDRFGRRVALLGSLLSIGLLTMASGLATTPLALAILRFVAGIGLGGAMPNATALASEYVPRRHQPFAVVLAIVCIPLGGSLAGLVGAEIVPRFGWRALFVVCGALPLVLAAGLLGALPESPRFLARHPARRPELGRLLRRLGHDVSSEAAFVDGTESIASRVSVRGLFGAGYARDTLALFGSFFFCLLAVYASYSWVPSLLVGNGFDVRTASYGLTALNLGGVVGAVMGAVAIMRFGSRVSMLTMAGAAIVGAVVLANMPIGPSATLSVFAMLAWTGGLIAAVQTVMYALAAHVYPTAMRATGVGTTVAVGRIGGVLSPSLGQWALDGGGAPWYFGVIASAMVVVFVALAVVGRHIPGDPTGPRGGAFGRRSMRS